MQMTATTTDPPYIKRRLPHRRGLLVAVASVVAVLAALGVRELRSSPSGVAPAPMSPPAVAPESAAMENAYGIRATRISLTAGGGMLDLRYVVLDSDAVQRIESSKRDRVALIIERTNRIMYSATMTMAHRDRLEPGQGSFILFRNDNGSIRRGDRVSFVIGRVVLRHLVVS
jgi:ribonucleotide monophosphatase NagD (HAD superfamily)